MSLKLLVSNLCPISPVSSRKFKSIKMPQDFYGFLYSSIIFSLILALFDKVMVSEVCMMLNGVIRA